MNEPRSSGVLLSTCANHNRPTVVKTMPKPNPQEFDEDWEEWTPDKGSFLNHMMAGSAAGVAEHVSIFPVDTIKTHMQCQRCPKNGKPINLSAIATARKLMAEEGPFRLFRGVSTMLSASLPAHAVYFSMFEAAKTTFGADSPDHTPISSGAAGVVATVCHDAIMTPMDVIKQRLQLGYYNGIYDCFRSIVQHEGVRALYRSLPTTFFMNLPYSMIMVSANETSKKILNPSGEMNVGAYMVSGAMAGALAGVLTNPLDVAKTRLQTQMMLLEEETIGTAMSTATSSSPAPCPSRSHCPTAHLQASGAQLTVPPSCAVVHSKSTTEAVTATASDSNARLHREPKLQVRYRGLLDALMQIRAQEGYAGFFRGVGPRLFVHAPSVAVSWTTFEVLKKTLDRMNNDDSL